MPRSALAMQKIGRVDGLVDPGLVPGPAGARSVQAVVRHLSLTDTQETFEPANIEPCTDDSAQRSVGPSPVPSYLERHPGGPRSNLPYRASRQILAPAAAPARPAPGRRGGVASLGAASHTGMIAV